MGPRYYILVGDEHSWRKSLLKNIWGFPENSVGNWNTSQVGDYVAFYVTNPIKKVVGYGRIIKKYEDNEIFWPDEKLFNKVIWKYRIEFEKLGLVDNWSKGTPVPPNIMLNTGRKVISKELFCNMLNKIFVNLDVERNDNF